VGLKKFSDLSPFKVLISFQGVVRSLEQIQDGLTEFQAEYVRKLLAEIYKYPELIEGIEKIEDVRKYEGTIKMLLADLFPMLLTHNEIKAVTIPCHYEIMNLTQRFQQILKDAGPDYELSFTGPSEHNLFIKSCSIAAQVGFVGTF